VVGESALVPCWAETRTRELSTSRRREVDVAGRVKNRMEKGDGMSFAEFSYPLIQAWDWYELYKKGVQVQVGGADQFGNILAGAEAVKAMVKFDPAVQHQLQQGAEIEQHMAISVTNDPLGFTVPLLTTASGEKFGKSAGNAVWLDPEMTSSYDLYQVSLVHCGRDRTKSGSSFSARRMPMWKSI